CARIQVEFDFW
nr:immunoglobulin heavy chain junction region [Macaca mulatta]